MASPINERYIAKQIIAALALAGIDAYVYHISKFDSIYIRFGDARLGTIRIANHISKKENLHYKWNILKTGLKSKDPYWAKSDGKYQYYCRYPDFSQLIINLLITLKTIRKNNIAEQRYNIPNHKRKYFGDDQKPLKQISL
jgi:hypothetical protein